MVVVLLRNYVTKESPYNNGFVHTRVRAYKKSGINTKVFVLNPDSDYSSYSIDDVNVYVGDKKTFLRMIREEESVTICVHFLDSVIIDAIEDIDNIRKTIIFVHGFEALRWYQRIFPGTFTDKESFSKLANYMISNTRELPIIRRFLRNTEINCQFVTVSNWMKEQAENAWKCKGQFEWEIIPNYVDSNMFAYIKKDFRQRERLLSIRPFTTGKYANDVTAKVINILNDNQLTDRFHFTWVGDGPLYERIVKLVKNNDSVEYVRRMLLQSEIVSFHRSNGIFICPTRQAAQGVSMCEAMSSGLVPITIHNTAIPEFLPDDKELICYNEKDMANLIFNLLNNEDLFCNLSEKCSQFIREKCSYENTIQKEIQLFN